MFALRFYSCKHARMHRRTYRPTDNLVRFPGLKNAFRIAVQESRSKLGLDADCTNAPASQMEAAPELVVSVCVCVCVCVCVALWG